MTPDTEPVRGIGHLIAKRKRAAQRSRKDGTMPRYMVQRTFTDGLFISADEVGAKRLQAVGQANAALGVNWVHSYVSRDKSMSFCVYDAPSAEAIWLAAKENGLPVDTITEVSVLDPYFYY
jgi:hypothetical protein